MTENESAEEARAGYLNDEASVEDFAREASDDAAHAGEKSGFWQWWLVVACLCLLAAVGCWLRGQTDWAFVAAALGVLAWFLNVRAGIVKSHDEDEMTGDE